MTAALASPSAAANTTVASAPKAPLGRLLRSELRWILRRPRTIIALALLALVPIVIGIGVTTITGPRAGFGGSPISTVVGNGLVLPVVALMITGTVLLPLIVSMAAADALAGESGHGTLRGLLIAPVSRVRLVAVKAAGVLTVIVLAVTVIAVVGVLTGLVIVGGNGMITFSGSTLGFGDALLRVGLAAVYAAVQLAAVAAIALAVSSTTEHPLVVLAATLGGLIVFGVLSTVPALEWLQPLLITDGWGSLVDVLRDPIPLTDMGTGVLRALCYMVIGGSLTTMRMITKDS